TSSISFYFSSSVELRALHSFPTRRSSDLTPARLRERVRFLLERYAEPVLVETYLPGPEFTVAILGNGPEAACLPVIGLDFSALPPGAPPVYGYEAKWVWDRPEAPLAIFQCPARVPGSL